MQLAVVAGRNRLYHWPSYVHGSIFDPTRQNTDPTSPDTTCPSFISSVSGQSKMPQQGSSSTWDVATTSLTVSIGTAYRSGLHSMLTYRALHCSAPPWVVIHMYSWRRHAAPTQAQVSLHWTACVVRSNLLSVNGRRSCFSCCWCKGVERPAKRGAGQFVPKTTRTLPTRTQYLGYELNGNRQAMSHQLRS